MIKKKRKRQKEFIELLEVTENSTKQTKTSIQKLKANQLSNFIVAKPIKARKLPAVNISKIQSQITVPLPASQKTSLEYNRYQLDSLENLDQPVCRTIDETPVLFLGRNMDPSQISQRSDRLREIMESYLNFKEMSLADDFNTVQSIDFMSGALADHRSPLAAAENQFLEEDLETGDIHDHDHLEPLLEHEAIIDGSPELIAASTTVTPKPANLSKKPKGTFKSKFHNTPEQEHQAKQHSFNLNLLSYIEMCTTNGMVNRGLGAVHSYRYKSRKDSSTLKITDINLFNTLLHGFAEKGNLLKTREIMNILREDNIKPTPQTYAAIFECLGRLVDTPEHLALLDKYFLEATEKVNVDFDDQIICY